MAMLTFGGNPPSRTRNVITVALIISTLAVFIALITCGVIKAIRLYKEHQETEALARNVWETEARRIEEEDLSMRHKLRSCITPDMSIIPSLPPVAHVSPAKRQDLCPTYVPGLISRSLINAVIPSDANASWAVHDNALSHPCFPPRREGRRPYPHIGRPSSLMASSIPTPLASATVDAKHTLATTTGERKALNPLTASEVERRRRQRNEGRRNGPRIAGKENGGAWATNLSYNSGARERAAGSKII